MKPMNIILISAIVFSTFIFSGCQSSNKQILTEKEETQETKDVREIAWNALSDFERKQVIGDWKDATVSKVIVDTSRFALNDPSFDGKEVTMVTFPSKNNALLGDISKLIDEKSYKVVGGNLRE